MRAEIARTGSVPPLICTSRVSKNDTGSSVWLAARTSSVSGTVGDASNWFWVTKLSTTATSRSGDGKGSGRSSAACSSE